MHPLAPLQLRVRPIGAAAIAAAFLVFAAGVVSGAKVPVAKAGDAARQTGGLGLGLLLARRILEAHRGTLEIESRVGEGTVARIRVPLAPSAMSALSS